MEGSKFTTLSFCALRNTMMKTSCLWIVWMTLTVLLETLMMSALPLRCKMATSRWSALVSGVQLG